MRQRIGNVITKMAAGNPAGLGLMLLVPLAVYVAAHAAPPAFHVIRTLALDIVSPVASWLF